MKLFVATICMIVIVWPQISLAHGGGTPRITDEPAGPYRVYAWTQPEPLRAGEIHVTIGVTAADTENAIASDGELVQPVTDAAVTLRLHSLENVNIAFARTATVGGVGAVYYEADARLPTAGQWRFIIDVQGDAGAGTVEFTEELLPIRRVNWRLLGAGGGAFLLLIVLIGMWNRQQDATINQTDGR